MTQRLDFVSLNLFQPLFFVLAQYPVLSYGLRISGFTLISIK